jgi:hypothetical protein
MVVILSLRLNTRTTWGIPIVNNTPSDRPIWHIPSESLSQISWHQPWLFYFGIVKASENHGYRRGSYIYFSCYQFYTVKDIHCICKTDILKYIHEYFHYLGKYIYKQTKNQHKIWDIFKARKNPKYVWTICVYCMVLKKNIINPVMSKCSFLFCNHGFLKLLLRVYSSRFTYILCYSK